MHAHAVQPEDSPRSILLVDDSPTVMFVLRTHLMNNGYQFYTASDASEGMKIVLRHAPDVVISDIQMPGMDGLQFFRLLRRAPGLSRVKLILASSKWNDDRRQAAARLGVSAMLEKPVQGAQLVDIVEGLLR